MKRARIFRQEGSIPLVMIASIIMAGVIVALFTVVQSSQRSVARDRDVGQSIQIADAGIQEAFTRLSIVDETTTGPLAAAVGELTEVVEGDAGQGSYRWQARRVAPSLWQVRSVGEFHTHTSVVETNVGLVSEFFFALWGDSEMGISAGNAEIGHLEGDAPVVGSNGPVTLHNDLADLVPDDLQVECHGDDGEENCDGITGADHIPGILEFRDRGFLAYGEPEELTDGSTIGGECADVDPEDLEQFTGQHELVRGTDYCFSQVTFPRNGEPFDLTGPTGVPVRIFIYHVAVDGVPEASLLVGGTGSQTSIVNWTPDDTDDPLAIGTSAAELLIYGGGTRPLEFRNNSSKIAAGILAPNARCEIRAQVTVVGSMICGEIPTTGEGSASGGWRLYYDPDLADVSVDGAYRMQEWAQESCNSSRFDWWDSDTMGCVQ